MKKTTKNFISIYFALLLPIILGILIYILYKLNIFIPTRMMPKCWIKVTTGYSCFGCGCTRAVQALLNFDISSSLYFNPIIIQGLFVYTLYIGSFTIALVKNIIFSIREYKKRSAINTERFKLISKYWGLKFNELFVYLLVGSATIFGTIRLIVEITASR